MATANVSDFLRRLACGMAAPTLGDHSDQQLVERALAGRDETAFQVIVHRHGPMVYRVCWRVLQHQQDAEDAFQATFLVLAEKLRTVRKHASLASWLHGVAHRVSLKARNQAAIGRSNENQAAAPAPLPLDEVTWGELRSALDCELMRLPDKWRLPLILCYLEGRTQDEAASQLGWSKSTLRRRLEEARTALGSRLNGLGIVWPAALSAILLSDCVASAAPAHWLVASTVETAAYVAAGKTVVTAASVKIATLTEGVLRAMSMTKLKTVTAMALLVAMIALGGALIIGHLLVAQERQPQTEPEGKGEVDPQLPKVGEEKKAVAKKDTLDGVIRVEFTGSMLVGLGGKIPDLTWHAFIIVNEKTVPLDFSKNEAVKKQIRDWYGDPPAEPGSSAIAARKVQVKGQMEFRGMILEVGKDPRSDGPIIVVESLKSVK